MKTSIFELKRDLFVTKQKNQGDDSLDPQLLMCFASKKKLADVEVYPKIKKRFPQCNSSDVQYSRGNIQRLGAG